MSHAHAQPATPSAPVARPSRDYEARVQQLSHASTQKYYQAYRDFDWDAPENQMDPHDARFDLSERHALGRTVWYRALPAHERAALGLEIVCQALKYGIGFENVLSQGLLHFAGTLANGDVEYRYALHETIEECQHSLMFQELINRAGQSPRTVNRFDRFMDRRIARCGATFPELFFFCVLAGEIFIDDENRALLRDKDSLHPLVRAVLQAHVLEEARHVRFAELFLKRNVPTLSWGRKRFIRAVYPTILRDSQRFMLEPASHTIARWQIPRETLREAFGPGSAHRERVEKIAAPAIALLGATSAGMRVFE